ncbi:MAG TPA: amino acid ABC transporter permease [Galbitalea sp.]
MATTGRDRSMEENTPSSSGPTAPVIRAVKLRHPWRNLIAVVLIVYAVAFIYDAIAHKPAFRWDVYVKYLFDQRLSAAALVTIELTVYSMILAIILALILAVMRLSSNRVLTSIAWLYVWIFRGTPVYVQLVLWGLLAVIYPTIGVGLPFLPPITEFQTNGALTYFELAVIGLGLNEAAYLAEIVRAGIISVDRGQEEAATALGMSWSQTILRIIIPQSMRVIIPPTGNEFIGMLKTTSLVSAVPFAGELYGVGRDISSAIFAPVPLLLAVSTWYLAVTSVFMIGQYFLERRFARGVGEARGTKISKSDLARAQLSASETGAATQRFNNDQKDS